VKRLTVAESRPVREVILAVAEILILETDLILDDQEVIQVLEILAQAEAETQLLEADQTPADQEVLVLAEEEVQVLEIVLALVDREVIQEAELLKEDLLL
jgi:hypothetical protein